MVSRVDVRCISTYGGHRMKTTQHPLSSLSFFALLIGAATIIALEARANDNVHVSRFWHNHQPLYWPEWNSNGSQNQRGQYAWDSIVLKPGQNYGGISPKQHPENNLTDIFGIDDRKNAYQGGPSSSLGTFSGGGFAMSYSGSLIDNVRQLGAGGHLGYGGGWNNGNTSRRQEGRLDLLGFTYHHSLGPLLTKGVFRKEVRIFKQAWWKAWGGNSDLSDHSVGFFPTEMAYSRHLIDVLVDEGFDWTLVASHHISRTSPSYNDHADPEGSYNIYSSPPNKADQLSPRFDNASQWWFGMPNPGNAAWNVAPFAYQLHKVQYIDPETGAAKEMFAVPSDDVLSYRYGYANEGIGKIVDHIAPHANVPVIVIPSTDGDNAWGGGSSSWMEATPQLFNESASRGYVKSMPDAFVNLPGNKANAPLTHIEDGAWIFPEMCYGSPNFLKWIEPPVATVANRGITTHPGTQIDMETPGFALKFFSYAPLMAGANWIETAEQVLRDEGGDVQDWKIATPYDWDGTWTSPNDVELAWHIYLKGLDSGFNYYGGLGNDDEVKPALATKNAIDKLQGFMTPARKAQDRTPPSVLKPQRFPYNPGWYTFGWFNNEPHIPNNNFLKRMPSWFYIWTHAYDLNGIASINVKVRIDNDGVNSMATTHNETYAGGSDVGSWITIPMTQRVLPKTRAALNAAAANGDIDYFVFDPAFWPDPVIADYYFVKIDDSTVPGFRGKLLDYYVESTDTLGNVHKSEIQHVWVEDDGGQSSDNPYPTFEPAAPSDCQPITVHFNAATSVLAHASTVYVMYRFTSSDDDWLQGAMTRQSTNTFSATLATNQIPPGAPFLEIAFHDGGDNWESNNGNNWKVNIRDCNAPENGVLFVPAAPDGCDPVTIRYYPAGRNLAAANPVYIHVGRNGWQDTLAPGPAMTQVGSYWEYTYVVATNTTIIDVAFNNGAGLWDSNGGNDWHVDVANCGDEPEPLPAVSINPTNPVGCGPITVTYNPSGRTLLGVNPVKIHVGRNGWQDVILPNPNMTQSGANWTYVYTPAPGTTNINMVFNDGGAVWDNNDDSDWHFAVDGCEDIPTGLAITNPPANISVANSVTTYSLAGIADGMEGDLTWTNTLTGASGSLPAAAFWSVSDVALGVGGNEIIVRGSNTTVGGTVTNAADDASDAAYSDGWNSGNSGGTGFLGWTFNHSQGTEGFAGCFIASPTNTGITGLGDTAFGFYANPFGSGANSEAQRDFTTPLGIGSTFRFHYGLNWDSHNEGSNRGFNLMAGDTELININMGNSQDITINGETLFANYGSQAMPLSFEYVADGSIRVRGTGRDGVETYDQTLTVPAGAPSRIKFYFNATDSSDERQMYFNNLAITSLSAGGVESHSDFIIITRQAGGDPQPPQIANMDPDLSGGGIGFGLSESLNGATYAIWASPTLFPIQNWQMIEGTDVPGTGGAIDLSITNGLLPTNFYRIGYTQQP